ncbi:MAG: ATP-dependent DNA ligase, partial [Acidobacteriales bacterium]|nr:ATP-dependent DNA ligase [Terriglobales bacterium]
KDLPVFYYVFDLIYADGYDMRRVSLVERKKLLQQLVIEGGRMRYSDHYPGTGLALFEAARQQGLEGIVAKRASSCYEERRTREWLKIKVTQTVDCVIGGYTNPEGSRQYFGSLVLGLYDKQRRLVHVGNAGTGFSQKSLAEMWKILEQHQSKKSPFFGPVEPRNPHWLTPDLVAEIKFTEWTHESDVGGVKLRAPVFLRLRDDKKPEECTIAGQEPEHS